MKKIFLGLSILGLVMLNEGPAPGQNPYQTLPQQFSIRREKLKWDLTNPNIKVAMQMFAAFNQHDWKKMANYYIEEAQFLDPAYGTEYVKKRREEIIVKYAGMEKMSPDIHDEIAGVYASGDKVIVEFVSSGSLKNGEKWSLPICSILTIKQGKIIKDATYYNNGK